MFKNKELDFNKSIQAQGIRQQDELYFYYSQLLQINCVCDYQNFTLQVDYIEQIRKYENIIKSKLKKSYKEYEINILCINGPYKLQNMWFETGITNNSHVDIQILLSASFTFKNLRFQEQIPSTWKVHKMITYIRGKRSINEIIQFQYLNKIIDYDLELYQLYPYIYDFQIEIINEPQYLIKLNDGRSKMIKINSQEKVSSLCELIKSEFNLNEDMDFDLQYGQMTLIHQALIIDEMILNNSTIIITNQHINTSNKSNQKTKETYNNQLNNNSILTIILVNKRNPSQIKTTPLNPSQQINNLDRILIPSNKIDKFDISYFLQEKQINDNTFLSNLIQDKETELKIEFTIQKKGSIMKNIVSYKETQQLRFKYLYQEYTQNVSITNTLKQIEKDIKQQYSIPKEYSIFVDDSTIQYKSITDLEIQSLNILFEFKKIDYITFEILIYPINEKIKLQTSKDNTVKWLREKIQKEYIKENDQARIQIKSNQVDIHDDQYISRELEMNQKNQIEIFILNKFQIQFQDQNQIILTDDVYEDYCLENCDFFINNTQIDTSNTFQFYNICSTNQIIKYTKTNGKNSQLSKKQEPSISKPHNFPIQYCQKQNFVPNSDQNKIFNSSNKNKINKIQ
ncbi:unnamed protein product [Paramecium pentaurelia]|uniref:Uncharacterized protein n=1 Tax=Paramecium pentaurelia TaxID=43138 RepID=A0A8S1YBY6_9CILI|nr:unnamed protein product [Paramecium pentaurelia]